PDAAGREPEDPLWRSQGRARLAGCSRRVSIAPEANHRYAGRYGARFSRAAETAWSDLSFALRSAESVPGECRGRTPFVGNGISAPSILRPRRTRGSRSSITETLWGSE